MSLYQNNTSGLATQASRFTQHLEVDMSDSKHFGTLHPHDLSETPRRHSTRSFEDFVPLEKLGTWETEDEKSIRKRQRIRRLKEKAKVLVEKYRGSNENKNEGYVEV
jgi:hypothetical protein